MAEEPSAGEPREPRATAGLDWSAAAAPERYSPPGQVSTHAVEPVVVNAAARQAWWRLPLLGLACAAVGALVGGGLVAISKDGAPASATATQPAVTAVRGAPTVGSSTATGSFAATAAAIRPSIVKISSTRRTSAGVEHDAGSGVLIDASGHIVTNAHVVLGTETLTVVLSDGSERPGILIGHDFPFNDVAVLQIGPPAGVQPMRAGDSTKLQLGEPVFALGNPLAEFDGTVTSGVISGLNRSRQFDQVRQDDMIQTDAALNNGSSGGALVNAAGEFIGMPTAVLRLNRGGQPVEGIGFAIPSNRVMGVAQAIITAGASLERPTLGLDHIDLGIEAAVRGCRPQVEEGALVVTATAAGPAASAGIQPCDIVTRIGNDAVDREHPLLNALSRHRVGEAAKVVLNRNGRIIEVEVRLAKRG